MASCLAASCATAQEGSDTDDAGEEKKPFDTGEGEDVETPPEDTGEVDSGQPPVDAGADTGSTMDAGTDTGDIDAGPEDTGPIDTGPVDTGFDTGIDLGPPDTGPIDTGIDLGPPDTGPRDTGPVDTGPPPDTGPGPGVNCPSFPPRFCPGSNACCIMLGPVAVSCGCNVPIFGCLPDTCS